MRTLIAGLLFIGFAACASIGESTDAADAPTAADEMDAADGNQPSPASARAAGSEQPSTQIQVDGDPQLEPYALRIDEALVELDMIPVPAGSIVIETEGVSEEVDVRPFWMSRTEVPWDLFDVYAFGSTDSDEAEGEDAVLRPSKPYGAPDRGYGHRGYAAISMSYLVATEFAKWLSDRTGDRYLIPNEAEWEFACRAGRSEPIREDDIQKYAWYWDNAFDETHPIGELEPNDFGLHDMIGNAAEWCTGLNGDPLACGGSFMNRQAEVGCSARMVPSPKWQETDPQIPKSRFWLTDGPFMGFRVIRVPDQQQN